ncbi:MAG TPA: hypothetical protein VFG39_01455 [Balneolaceae bacterium]|nr:hypothetical protein [Balneolaceae bacterium]
MGQPKPYKINVRDKYGNEDEIQVEVTEKENYNWYIRLGFERYWLTTKAVVKKLLEKKGYEILD